jgi:hypothetical protein
VYAVLPKPELEAGDSSAEGNVLSLSPRRTIEGLPICLLAWDGRGWESREVAKDHTWRWRVAQRSYWVLFGFGDAATDSLPFSSVDRDRSCGLVGFMPNQDSGKRVLGEDWLVTWLFRGFQRRGAGNAGYAKNFGFDSFY